MVVVLALIVLAAALPSPQTADVLSVIPDKASMLQGDYANGYPYPHPDGPHDPANFFPFDHSCKDHCSGHGECIHGVCECELDFKGTGCETAVCANDCSGRGICTEGVCDCRKGWASPDCNTSTCPNMCSGNGRCFEGDCFCQPEWNGDDCSQPKFGIPGITRPPDAGYPVNTRLNDSCVVFRLAPVLVPRVGPELTKAVIIAQVNQTCVQLKETARGVKLTTLEVLERYPATQNITVKAGDHLICGIPDGCSEVTVLAYYGNDGPIEFVNGVSKPAPSPEPPLPNEVDVSFCGAEECSSHGVCLNVTLPVSGQTQFECKCHSPWIPPSCCVMDRLDTSAPQVDPLSATMGELPFNHVPCSQSDACFACDQTLDTQGTWIKLNESQCGWDGSTSRCNLLHDTLKIPLRHFTCRSSTMPEQLKPDVSVASQ